MKRFIYVMLVALMFVSCSKDDCTQEALSEKVIDVSRTLSKNTSGKVTVCHVLANGNTQTIEINEVDLQFHLDHGDELGECPTLSDGGLNFNDGKVVEIDCKYELPFIHIADDGSTWYFSSPK